MSTHTSILVDSVGPPRAEVCRTSASFPQVDHPKYIELREVEVKDIPLKQLAIKKQEVSCVHNTPNTIVRGIGALVMRTDGEIQVIWMILCSNCNL